MSQGEVPEGDEPEPRGLEGTCVVKGTWHLTPSEDTRCGHSRELGQTMSRDCCPSHLPTPATMHKSPRLRAPSPLQSYSDPHKMATLPAAARVTVGLVTGLSAPGWPQPSSTHFRVAVKGNPFTQPHTDQHFRLLEMQKDPGPHAEDWAPCLLCPLVTELLTFTRCGFHFHKVGRNSALSTPKFAGRFKRELVVSFLVPL